MIAPLSSKIPALLYGSGGTKLVWFRILNISARNWMLNVSDIRWIGLFLVAEKSRLTSFGPMRVLRPALPSRLAQYTWPLGGGAAALLKLVHWAASGEEADTVGRVKQLSLI